MPSSRRLSVENLEARQLLAASVGWDGPGRGSANLTYHIANTPSTLDRTAVEGALKTALDAWSAAADIRFTPTATSGLPNSIDFSFRNLDGPGGTLAQAYFPADVNPSRLAGDVQFDSSETWEIGNALGRRAFDLVAVAVHEIGHALGLDHSVQAESILLPSISAEQSFVGLGVADTQAIRELYAPAPATPPPAISPPVGTVSPALPTPRAPSTSLQIPRMRPPVWFESPPLLYWRSWFTGFSGFNWRGFGISRIEVGGPGDMHSAAESLLNRLLPTRPLEAGTLTANALSATSLGANSFNMQLLETRPSSDVRDRFWENYRPETNQPRQVARWPSAVGSGSLGDSPQRERGEPGSESPASPISAWRPISLVRRADDLRASLSRRLRGG